MLYEGTQNLTLNSRAYSYNQASRRTQQVFTAGNYIGYAYDPIGQLQAAQGKEAGGAISRFKVKLPASCSTIWSLCFWSKGSNEESRAARISWRDQQRLVTVFSLLYSHSQRDGL